MVRKGVPQKKEQHCDRKSATDDTIEVIRNQKIGGVCFRLRGVQICSQNYCDVNLSFVTTRCGER